jgi:glycerol-3-phosphate dehydrogenase (NAD(P)+)
MQHKPIAMVGHGAFGAALATRLACTRNIVMYNRTPQTSSTSYEVTHCINDLPPTWPIIITLSCQGLYNMVDLLATVVSHRAVLIAAKGFWWQSSEFLSHQLSQHWPNTTVHFLSGPSFAHELCHAHSPVGFDIAGNMLQGALWYYLLATKTCHIALTDDVIGVQIGGMVKNILAILSGLLDGLNMGLNAKAHLITRGLQEASCLIRHFGGRSDTLMGYSGIGDVVGSCHHKASRNYRLGTMLAQGTWCQHKDLSEGVQSARVLPNWCPTLALPVLTLCSQCLDHPERVQALCSEILGNNHDIAH